jgi:hypothetical protein
MHDWKRVRFGLFSHFHQDWCIEIARTLNRGFLSKGIAALIEQRVGRRDGDGIAIESKIRPRKPIDNGNVATAERPVTRIVRLTTN